MLLLFFPHSLPFSLLFYYWFQLSAEFSRIVTKDLLESFLDGLDALVPGVLQMYGEAAASGRRVRLSSVLSCLQKEVCTAQKSFLVNVLKLVFWLGYLIHKLLSCSCRTRTKTKEQLSYLVFHATLQKIPLT